MNTLMATTTLLLVTPSWAKSYPELTQFVDENTQAIAGALASVEDGGGLGLGKQFDLRRFLLRVQAKVGFDVEVAKIELIPELELVFQKQPVSG